MHKILFMSAGKPLIFFYSSSLSNHKKNKVNYIPTSFFSNLKLYDAKKYNHLSKTLSSESTPQVKANN